MISELRKLSVLILIIQCFWQVKMLPIQVRQSQSWPFSMSQSSRTIKDLKCASVSKFYELIAVECHHLPSIVSEQLCWNSDWLNSKDKLSRSIHSDCIYANQLYWAIGGLNSRNHSKTILILWTNSIEFFVVINLELY